MDISLFQNLCKINATSGDEGLMKKFILNYIKQNENSWECKPIIFEGDGFQDNIILIFGVPTVAYYAHMDSVGFTTRYQNQLIDIGSPEPRHGDQVVGEDSLGLIECNINVDKKKNITHNFPRAIDTGTPLIYKPNFKMLGDMITSPSLDNRTGIFVLLQLAAMINNGALVFSTYEEHGGGSAGYLGEYLYRKYNIKQNLIVDVTWVTEGVQIGHGPVVSLRDAYIPRREFLKKILFILDEYSMVYQKEVESGGGSDGSELQRSALPIDWCFLGVPVNNPHSSHEEAYIFDIARLVSLLETLSKEL